MQPFVLEIKCHALIPLTDVKRIYIRFEYRSNRVNRIVLETMFGHKKNTFLSISTLFKISV